MNIWRSEFGGRRSFGSVRTSVLIVLIDHVVYENEHDQRAMIPPMPLDNGGLIGQRGNVLSSASALIMIISILIRSHLGHG